MEHRMWIMSIGERDINGQQDKKDKGDIIGYLPDIQSGIDYVKTDLLAEFEMDIDFNYEEWLEENRYDENQHSIDEFRENMEENLNDSLTFLKQDMEKETYKEKPKELYIDGVRFTYFFTLVPPLLPQRPLW